MYPDRLQRLARDAEELQYFFALACFNLTHIILVFFDLVNAATVSPIAGARRASRREFLNFFGLCSRSPRSPATVLNELFVALLERLNATWKQMRATRECNVMQHFHEAMHMVFDANANFWNERRETDADFRMLAQFPQAGL
jgi:hypothetical protein